MVLANFEGRTKWIGQVAEVKEAFGLPSQSYYLLAGGRLWQGELLGQNNVIEVRLRLLGGKGGYGKMMKCRAIKNFKPVQQNYSRDLDGRYLIHRETEQQLVTFIKRKQQEDQVVAREVELFRKEQGLLSHQRQIGQINQNYEASVAEVIEQVKNSVALGLKRERNRSLDHAEKEAEPSPQKLGKEKKDQIQDRSRQLLASIFQ